MKTAPSFSGASAWVIHDPVQNKYLQIDSKAFELLSLWRAAKTVGNLKKLAFEELGLFIDLDQIKQLITFLETNQLTVEPPQSAWRKLFQLAKSRERAWWNQLLHNYLFLRIPLIRPQKFLERTLWLVEPLYSTAFFTVVMLLAVFGAYLASRQWEEFTYTFANFLSFKGVFGFLAALIAVKAIHELAHAYTAVRYRCRVPVMGVALIVLAPMVFVDVSDSWRLKNRRQRFWIDAAGVISELALAAMAIFLWAFLPDGFARSIAFFIVTASLALTLAMNLNPLMRFDGYFVLSDLIGIDNLQERSFALGRWWLRELLLAPGDPPPESFPAHWQRGLIAFAWSVWIYRLFLFLGIALLVYYYFFKALGVFLFVVEILYFIALPVYREVKQWPAVTRRSASRRRMLLTGGVMAALMIAGFIPLSATVVLPAVVEPIELESVFPQNAGTIEAVHVKAGQAVASGQKLASLTSSNLSHQVRLASAELELIRLRLDRRTANSEEREDSAVLSEQLRALTAKLNGLREEQRKLVLAAPRDGDVIELNARFHEGRAVSRKEPFVVIASPQRLVARAYSDEHSVERLEVGAIGRFIPAQADLASFSVTLKDVAPNASREIDIAELTSPFGGAIAAEETPSRTIKPHQSQYAVRFSVEPGRRYDRTLIGVVHVSAKPASWFSRLWKQILKVLIRESGF